MRTGVRSAEHSTSGEEGLTRKLQVLSRGLEMRRNAWLLCGGFEDGGGAVEGVGEGGELGLGAGGVGGVDGFVDAGDDDGGVAGELAGGVDGVSVPGAFGQAVGVEQGALRRRAGLG